MFLLGNTMLNAQQPTYNKVKVFFEDNNMLERLAGLNFDVDHPEFEDKQSISLYLTETEIDRLRANGFRYEITIPDYNAYYMEMLANDLENQQQMTRSSNVAAGFDLGSMGGFYTFAEVEAKLDEMKQNFPNLITARTSIGTSIEGRPIWMVKISDNPNINEPEPAAYFDALHHAREPLSMATTINYMFWLLENYSTDPMVQFLVDNREIYFIPVVNPDGYVYNETTNPNGGGFWRKNRNPNAGGCAGVDLNRNYSFGYGVNGSCSSTDPCSGTYRGTAPFSEPETTAVRDFLDLIEPNTAFSTHSTAGSYLMPYGFDTSPPEFNTYSEWASAFLDENDYPYGVTFQMLGYTSCGTTRDYLHSEGIYGWTPEIDGNGFWPTPSTIFTLVAENVRPLFYQSWIAGAYLDVQSHALIGDVLPGESFQLVVEIKNTGVGADAQNVSVIVSTSHSNVMVPTANGYGTVAARTRKDNSASPFIISLDSGFNDSSFNLIVTTYQDGVENESIEIPVYVGEKSTLFFDDAEAGAGSWTATGNGISWGLVADDSYSGNSSFGDSDGGNGENNTLNYFTLNESFDFTGDITPVVTFACKWSVEIDDDVDLQISTDGGSNWTTLEQYSGNNDWMTELLELDAYAGFSDVRFRFKMNTDNSIPGDGFYFDDFTVSVYENAILGNSDIENFGITVYPNPFNNSITVMANNELIDEITELKLYDISGRSIDIAFEKEDSSLHISNTVNLFSGIYFLNIINAAGDVIAVKKMVKI